MQTKDEGWKVYIEMPHILNFHHIQDLDII